MHAWVRITLTSSILQLAIHSNVEMLKVACPIEVWHQRVIIGLQLRCLHNVASRRTGNLTRLLSLSCSSISCSTNRFEP